MTGAAAPASKNAADAPSDGEVEHAFFSGFRVMVAWLEDQDDVPYFPFATESNLVICVIPLSSGLCLVRVLSDTPHGGGPLADGMIISRSVLGPMVRQTVLASSKRFRAAEDDYVRPHMLRKKRIEDMVKEHRLTAARTSDIYFSLFGEGGALDTGAYAGDGGTSSGDGGGSVSSGSGSSSNGTGGSGRAGSRGGGGGGSGGGAKGAGSGGAGGGTVRGRRNLRPVFSLGHVSADHGGGADRERGGARGWLKRGSVGSVSSDELVGSPHTVGVRKATKMFVRMESSAL